MMRLLPRKWELRLENGWIWVKILVVRENAASWGRRRPVASGSVPCVSVLSPESSFAELPW